MGDFDEKAIEFYKNYYKNLSVNGKKYTHSGVSIKVAGDVCFNLKLKNGKFFTLYGSIIEKDEVFDRLNEQLEKVRYTPMNISIMPKTGGLNNIKKSFGNDRFDSFGYLLSEYYAGNKVPIINGGTVNSKIGNRLLLARFLDSYSTVYEYFKDFYGIEDKQFINEIVEAGSHWITTKENFFEYIELAVKFWQCRLEQDKIKEWLKNEEKEEYTKIFSEISDICNSILRS